jgi:hypothetical protein
MTRPTTDECPRLNVNSLERAGFLTPGTTSEWKYLTIPPLSLVCRAERSHVVITFAGVVTAVEIVREDRYLGGQQCYLACPRCGDHRTHLYIMPGHLGFRLPGHLGCRGCLPLSYRSKREWRNPDPGRVARVRTRLGAEPRIGAPLPPRPHKCRLDYYRRWLSKLAAIEAKAQVALRGIIAALEREKERSDA